MADFEDKNVGKGDRQTRANARQVVEVVALEADDDTTVNTKQETKRDACADDEQQRTARACLFGTDAGNPFQIGRNEQHDQIRQAPMDV